MTQANLHIFSTNEQTAEALALQLYTMAVEKQKLKQQLFIAISGGSTPNLLFAILVNKYQKIMPWGVFRFYWVDERCVPIGDTESNYGTAKALLFDYIALSETQIERIRGENNPADEAVRYAQLINNQLPKKDGIPTFDLIVLGMGDDGHTASIFPNQQDIMQSRKLCEPSEHPITGQKRITLTLKTICNSKHIVLLVTGSSKAKKLVELVHLSPASANYPVTKILDTKGALDYYFDKEAAQLLNY